jgi:hypothetical protein
MYPFRQTGKPVTIAAATAVARTAQASHVLVSNTGSESAWADFGFSATNAVPATPLIPIPPGRSELIACPASGAYWCSSIGGLTVTPVEVF